MKKLYTHEIDKENSEIPMSTTQIFFLNCSMKLYYFYLRFLYILKIIPVHSKTVIVYSNDCKSIREHR